METAQLADEFEQQRPRLTAVAQRMLGNRADAEDAVQEAWLRLARTDRPTIDNLPGWLTTVVGRICLDLLRSRTTRPPGAYDELVVVPDDGATPDAEVEVADSVGLALLVVLETLSPAERLSLVLHDFFAVPFDEISLILGKSEAATKMLASRARRKVRRPDGTGGEHDGTVPARTVVDAFLGAARGGDFAGLLKVLDPDVVLRADTPGGIVVTLGATEVAGRAKTFGVLAGASRAVLVDGLPGALSVDAGGAPMSLLVFTVERSRITQITALADPALLARIPLPGLRGREGQRQDGAGSFRQ